MMRHKITYKLIGYFSAVLLVFSIIIGAMFRALFNWHTAEIHKEELKERAVTIAGTLSEFPNGSFKGRGIGGGYGAYLRFIDEIAMSEVWLVDERAQTVQMGHMRGSLSYEELPSGAEGLIEHVFAGNVEATRAFSSLIGAPSITVGAPVFNSEGSVAAALLLHSSIDGMERTQKDGIIILTFCILTALLLAVALSAALTHHFIDPLKKMERATQQMKQGNYSIHTGVKQNDEIGSLASNIDDLSIILSNVEEQRKKLDKMRQDFVSNISHELRTPVTVIKGSLEVLAEGLITDTQEMKDYLRQMLTDTSHLERLVNDLLELSRLQNTNFKIEKTELNLTDVLTDAIRSMQRISDQRSVRIVLENETGAVRFYGDYGRLRQMFMIILDNAVKFSPLEDQVLVNMYCQQDGRFVVSISDHGTGILPEDTPYIFDRFYREPSEQNKSGSGLGLSIAKQIADRHDIAIHCTSKPGELTTFSFEINNPTIFQSTGQKLIEP